MFKAEGVGVIEGGLGKEARQMEEWRNGGTPSARAPRSHNGARANGSRAFPRSLEIAATEPQATLGPRPSFVRDVCE